MSGEHIDLNFFETLTRQALSCDPRERGKGDGLGTAQAREKALGTRLNLEADINGLGPTLCQLERKAQDRDSWRTLVGDLCPRKGTRDIWNLR